MAFSDVINHVMVEKVIEFNIMTTQNLELLVAYLVSECLDDWIRSLHCLSIVGYSPSLIRIVYFRLASSLCVEAGTKPSRFPFLASNRFILQSPKFLLDLPGQFHHV